MCSSGGADLIRINGMLDLINSMEDRVVTLKYRVPYPDECSHPSVVWLLERA